MDPTPEQLLGLPVVDPRGARVGTVVDVGLSTWRQPKFLLVAPDGMPQPLLRVEFGDVGAVGAEVRLAVPVRPAGLPA